jgi:hypothetical protein
MATLSGFNFKYCWPLISAELDDVRLSSGLHKWEYKIFSAKVNGWLFNIFLTVDNLLTNLEYGGVLDSYSGGTWKLKACVANARVDTRLLMTVLALNIE